MGRVGDLTMVHSFFRLVDWATVAVFAILGIVTLAKGAFANEGALLTNERQLTFEGNRAGEGYFSVDGSTLIFQSERLADNPFYQIYLMDIEMGGVKRISPGHGKATCAWLHPDGEHLLFSSTLADPKSLELQRAELDFRASGEMRRYAWDYDPHYEIYSALLTAESTGFRNLTNAEGYDAEASYSPDGEWIAFASNRHAYSEALSDEDAKLFEHDKSYLMDIYLMRADGSDVTRLTDTKGYDGGPFFSPDGRRITWRRFAPDGATAEVYTMNLGGGDVQQITSLGAMSWAPYYHPSGDYIIFATNIHGFGNFELYLVDAEGEKDPVRVTDTDGFDGLPVFSPDGARLAWTSGRTPDKSSQIFMAEWNDAAAREGLELNADDDSVASGLLDAGDANTVPVIPLEDYRMHVEYLASESLEGRRAGTRGEQLATAYVATNFELLGLHPAGDDGTYFQEFEFTAGVSLGANNALRLANIESRHAITFGADDWRPLAFSRTDKIDAAEIVFAGYGIKAPKTDEVEEYDSFTHLDVTDKWVMVFRYMPAGASDAERRHFARHSSLRFKAMTVRDLGAKGLIVVSGPNSGVKRELVDLAFDVSLGGTNVAAISVTDTTAGSILAHENKTLKQLQDELDTGDLMMGFSIAGKILGATIEIQQEKRTGRNAVARLFAKEEAGDSAIVIGAHVDHLGIGRTGNSLARDEESEDIHFGADDNASGVAGMLEIAQYLKRLKDDGLEMTHDAIFAAWSGEELGLLGAYHFTGTFPDKESHAPLTPEIAAYLNMDMIGRMKEKVVIQGVGSSSIWPAEIERHNVPVGLSISPANESYLPTDATAFYLRGVPFLNAFTGAHEDYHTPRDTADKIAYENATQIATFMGRVAQSLVSRAEAPDYVAMEKPENMEMRANLKAYLGTIPDYAEGDAAGLALSGVAKSAPADKAGLRAGDLIIELAGRTIENIYDYTFAIEALKVGEEVEVVILRGGEQLSISITPESRE